MAVTLVTEIPGATHELYDKVRDNLGMSQEGALIEGQLAHIASPMDGGWRVVDVWESREVFDRFSQEQIGPFSQQAGITEPPETTYRDVHNHLPHS